MVFPGKIQFSACNNTKQGMEKAEGHAISILPDATIVPSGVVRLMECRNKAGVMFGRNGGMLEA